MKKQTWTSAHCLANRRVAAMSRPSSQVCLIAVSHYPYVSMGRMRCGIVRSVLLLPVARKAFRRGGVSACAAKVDCTRKSRRSRYGHLVAARDGWVVVSSILSVQVSPGGPRLRAANSTATATFSIVVASAGTVDLTCCALLVRCRRLYLVASKHGASRGRVMARWRSRCTFATYRDLRSDERFPCGISCPCRISREHQACPFLVSAAPASVCGVVRGASASDAVLKAATGASLLPCCARSSVHDCMKACLLLVSMPEKTPVSVLVML